MSTALPQVQRLIEAGIEQRWQYGMQVYVSLAGEPVANLAVGENAPGATLAPDTLMLWLSAGKPLTAVAILQLQERGLLRIDDRVTHYLPEFVAAGKEHVTVRHLLTHTGGLKPVVLGWPDVSWEDIVARICRTPLVADWVPGARGAYDPARSWFLLGEIIRRTSGLTVEDYLRREVLEPLGMSDTWLSVPLERQAIYGSRVGVIYGLRDGHLVPTASNLPTALIAPSPGSTCRGPASQLGRFYEMLLRGGTTSTGQRILREDTVQEMTSRQRVGIHDETFQQVIDFGWGVIINSAQYSAGPVPYGFGEHASAETFGHGGAQSSLGLADPAHGLVAVLIANGTPGDAVHQERFHQLTTALYEDLGLARV